MKIFTSESSHYSLDKGAVICGLGTDSLVKVKVDRKGRMCPVDLDKKLTESKNNKEAPILVNATVGTTVFGAIDPIDAIADVCKSHKVWCHLDAALGGSSFFAPSKNELTKGVEKVDSITYDFHKSCATPLQTSVFMTKHVGTKYDANSMKAK